MIEMSDDSDQLTAADMVSAIREEFSGVSGPVSVEHFAALYGVLAAQSDAILSLFALVAKANPQIIFTDEMQSVNAAIKQQSNALSTGLIDLAKAYGNTESKP